MAVALKIEGLDEHDGGNRCGDLRRLMLEAREWKISKNLLQLQIDGLFEYMAFQTCKIHTSHAKLNCFNGNV